MKGFKKVLKKMPKKMLALLIIMAVLVNYIVPITNVVAQNYGEGDKCISLDITNDLKFTINSVKVNSYDWKDGKDRFNTNDDKYHIVITVSGNENTNNIVPQIQYGGNFNDVIKSSTHESEGVYTFVLDLDNSTLTGERRQENSFLGLSIIEKQPEPEHHDNQNPGEPNNNNPEEPRIDTHFDGKAYVIWSCGTGTCYHYFDDIPAFDDGSSTYYKASEVTADNNPNIKFNIKAEQKGWVLKEAFDIWVENYKKVKNITGDLDWSTVDPKDIVGDPIDMREWEDKAIKAGACTRENVERDEFERCVDKYVETNASIIRPVKLQPLPDEPYDNNAYVSYGDRNFKVVIYNEEYKGVSIGNLEDLHYYPASWTNPFVRQDQFDISGTTKENPTIITSILLEDTINIRTLDKNSFNIEKIEALDVSEEAVKITKTNNEYKIVFTSNFYDNVVFKTTDKNGKEEYFKIERKTIEEGPRYRENKPVINVGFYFDRTKKYTDFDITATIVYKDGNNKKITLEAIKGIDDGLGNITPEYEVDEQSNGEFGNSGKGLKKSTFEYLLKNGEEQNISKVYVNVEYKGTTETNYAGAFAGSGKGVVFNYMEEE